MKRANICSELIRRSNKREHLFGLEQRSRVFREHLFAFNIKRTNVRSMVEQTRPTKKNNGAVCSANICSGLFVRRTNKRRQQPGRVFLEHLFDTSAKKKRRRSAVFFSVPSRSGTRRRYDGSRSRPPSNRPPEAPRRPPLFRRSCG